MTKKEKLEKLLTEIPELQRDYSEGKVRKYTPHGKYDLTDTELNLARSRARGGKLLCVIEQDAMIAGERVSLVNYIVDVPGFSPKKNEYLSPEFYRSDERIVSADDYIKVAYVFQSYCYNATWQQNDHGEVGIIPNGSTIIRVW